MSRATPAEREATKRWISEAGLIDAKLAEVTARLQAELPFGEHTWIPDESTVFRWQQKIRSDRAAATGELQRATRGRPQEDALAASVATTTSSAMLLSRLPDDATREAFVARILALESSAEALHAQIAGSPHLTPDLQREYKTQRTWTSKFKQGEKGPRGTFDLDGVHRRYEELRALVAVLTAALNANIVEQAITAPYRPPGAALIPAITSRQSNMPFAGRVRDQQIAGLGETEYPRPVFGALIATTEHPEPGAIVRYAEANKTQQDAELRAILVAPVLAKELSARQAAALWQKHFHKRTTASEDERLPVIPSSLWSTARNTYYKISPATLAKWARRVHTATKARPDAAVIIPAASLLLHRKPASASDTARKITPEIAAQIRRQFLRQDDAASADENAHALISAHNINATMIRDWIEERLGVQLNERTVQRYVARKIADADKIVARGGTEAGEFLRLRLIRQAAYPNAVWIADHSFFRGEVTDDHHPEWLDQLDEFDFSCAFARHIHSTGAPLVRRHVRKMSMTLIVDAFSRRKLALRVWEGTPSTVDTLMALHDAVVRFGVPEYLYTDNGSDFTSRRMMSAIQGLGVRSVRSKPYCPQGRGIVERDFSTIKSKILPLMVGFCGDAHAAAPSLDELDDHASFESKLWDRVNKVMNLRKHGETGEVPAEHYDRNIGASMLNRPSDEALLGLLTEREDVIKKSIGLQAFGGRYTGPGLNGIPEGARVVVHGDPYRLQLAHVSTYDEGGNLRYRGPVERYGNGGGEAPQHDVFSQMQVDWLAEKEHTIKKRIAAAATRTRKQVQAVDGRLLAENLSQMVQQKVLLLSSGKCASDHAVDSAVVIGGSDANERSETEPDAPFTAIDALVPQQVQTLKQASNADTAPVVRTPTLPDRARHKGAIALSTPWD